MIDITALVKPGYPLENSGLEYIVFELCRNALRTQKVYTTDEESTVWEISWDNNEKSTLEFIRNQLKSIAPNDEAKNKITQCSLNVFKIPGNNIDLCDLVLQLDNSVQPATISLINTHKYELNYGVGSIAAIVASLQSFEVYKKTVAQILATGYSKIIECVYKNQINELKNSDLIDIDLEKHKRDVLIPVAREMVNEKPRANLHAKVDFTFVKIDLGHGEFPFPLDLNDLSRVDTENFNKKYRLGYNPDTKIGFAETILALLNIQSLQATRFAEGYSSSSNDGGVSPLRSLRFPFTKKNISSESTSPKKIGSPPTVGAPVSPRRTNSALGGLTLPSFQNFVGSKDAFASEGSGNFVPSRAPTPTSPLSTAPLRLTNNKPVTVTKKRFSLKAPQ